MNLGSLNGFALNSSALATWVKAALVAASIGCDASAVATYNYRVTSALSAGGAGATQAALTQAATSALSASGSATASAGTIWGGRSALAAGSFGVAFVYRTIPATVTGAAGASGTAIPNDKLGAAEPSAGLGGAASGTKIQFTTAALSAGGDGEARAQFGSPVLGYGTALGLAEASTQLFGETIFNHDGFVVASPSATATVAETHWKRFIAGTVTPAASLSGTAQANKIHPGHAALSGGLQNATVDYRNLLYGETSATLTGTGDAVVAVRTQSGTLFTAGANALAAAKMTWGGRVAATGVVASLATPSRVQPGAATLTAGMDFISSQFADQYWATASGEASGDGAAAALVLYRYWATASGEASGDGSAAALMLQLAGASGSSGSEAEAAGNLAHLASSSATLIGAGEAEAITNIEVDAPLCRTLTLATEDRVVRLSHDNRIMTPGC